MAALDFPNSPTLNQLYAAPNGATYKWDGTAWIVAAAGPPTELWTDTGTALTPYDATKRVTVPGPTAAGADQANIVLGSRTIKARVMSYVGGDGAFLTLNQSFNGTAWQRDDAAKPGWTFNFDLGGDALYLSRMSAAGALSTLLTLDNAGNLTGAGNLLLTPATATALTVNTYGYGTTGGSFSGLQARGTPGATTASQIGDFLALFSGYGCYAANSSSLQGQIRLMATENWSSTNRGNRIDFYLTNNGTTTLANTHQFQQNGDIWISGNNATKNTGTTWINPSDPRLKQDVAPYAAGLADICQLAPITYRLKAQGPDGPLCYGFDAEQVRDVFPECVSTTKMKLDSADDEETEDVLVFDMHPILVALVNAVKELTAKVDGLTKGA